MGAVELDSLSWPGVKAPIESGRDTVVVVFGAFEQHGLHLPLETDSLLSDHLAQVITDPLDAFVAPTMKIGCSRHHVGFPDVETTTVPGAKRSLRRDNEARADRRRYR